MISDNVLLKQKGQCTKLGLRIQTIGLKAHKDSAYLADKRFFVCREEAGRQREARILRLREG